MTPDTPEYAQAGKVRMAYQQFGDPDHPALLLVMGLGDRGVRIADRRCEPLRFGHIQGRRWSWFSVIGSVDKFKTISVCLVTITQSGRKRQGRRVGATSFLLTSWCFCPMQFK